KVRLSDSLHVVRMDACAKTGTVHVNPGFHTEDAIGFLGPCDPFAGGVPPPEAHVADALSFAQLGFALAEGLFRALPGCNLDSDGSDAIARLHVVEGKAKHQPPGRRAVRCGKSFDGFPCRTGSAYRFLVAARFRQRGGRP